MSEFHALHFGSIPHRFAFLAFNLIHIIVLQYHDMNFVCIYVKVNSPILACRNKDILNFSGVCFFVRQNRPYVRKHENRSAENTDIWKCKKKAFEQMPETIDSGGKNPK